MSRILVLDARKGRRVGLGVWMQTRFLHEAGEQVDRFEQNTLDGDCRQGPRLPLMRFTRQDVHSPRIRRIFLSGS